MSSHLSAYGWRSAGDTFYAFVAGKDGQLHPAGATTKLALRGDFYVGLGVSAHDKDDVPRRQSSPM